MSIRPTRLAASLMLATAATALLAGPARAVTPGPTPVVITNGPVATVFAPTQPFMATVTAVISAGANAGGANNNTSGSQSVAVPAGKRLVVQAVSAYRGGAPVSGTSVQVFVDSLFNGLYSGWPVPPIVAGGSAFPGTASALTWYVDGGTSLLVNAFRNSTSGSESVIVSISGYLVDAP